MPELPEIETIKNNLQIIINYKVDHYQTSDKKSRLPAENLLNLIMGATINKITRRGKYLLIHLNNNYIIVIHLGMSGVISLVDSKDYHIAKHDHLLFFIKNKILVFNDSRRFGFVDIIKSEQLEKVKYLARLGAEPLTLNFEDFKLFLQNKKNNIKNFFMDGGTIVGIGNIYCSEIFFAAKISPLRLMNSLSEDELKALYNSIKNILIQAIKAGGSSIKNYRNIEGKIGNFSNQFQVYNRAGLACYQCGAIILKIIQNARSTYYCPHCQK